MENSKQEVKPLTVRAIEAMRPGDVRIDAAENAGLRVSCGSTGLKTFVYRYRSPVTQKLTQLKIGNFPAVSLAQARAQLAEWKQLRSTGVCPKAEIKLQVQRQREEREWRDQKAAAESFTVRDLVELYLAEVIEDRVIQDERTGAKKRIPGARKLKGQAETRRTLYGDPVKVLGDMSASRVTRRDVVEMVRAIVGRGANVQAGSVLRELIAAYEYAIGTGRLDDDFANPALLAKASLKTARVRLTAQKGRRVLSDKEIRMVLDWLPGSGYSVTQKNVIWFSFWTGCRTGEVCKARWTDIDMEDGVWHLRDSKNGSERLVQLPEQAVAFLRQLRLTTDTYLFPSMRTGEPIQQKSLSETKWQLKNPDKVRNGRQYKPHQLWLTDIPDWSPHDIRRTVRTGLARLGCRSEVAEAILGHARRGIEGTYDLHSYDSECREWLQKWADHIDKLAAGRG